MGTKDGELYADVSYMVKDAPYEGYDANGGMVFRNTYTGSEVVPTTGTLRISKTVSGSGADQNGVFQFRVLVGSVNGGYSGVAFTDGAATVSVKAGSHVDIQGLPAGTSYSDGTFRPGDPITRAELTKIAAGFFADKRVTAHYDGRFSDVSGSEWFISVLEKGIEEGIIQGYQDGTFAPNQYITRAQACTIINRTLGRQPEADRLLPDSQMLTWPDSDPSAWYYAQMQEATNSHDYTWVTTSSGKVEKWTKKLPDRDWAALEHIWSRANSSTGGEAMN